MTGIAVKDKISNQVAFILKQDVVSTIFKQKNIKIIKIKL